VIVFAIRAVRSPAYTLALGLILGGALGNIHDRLLRDPSPFHGAVVDFLELPHWPVFNVADMGVVGGAILIVALGLFGVAAAPAGERVDVGISRMLGLSRTRAADLVSAGHVLVDGAAPARSTRLEPGVMVHVELPEEKPAVEVRPQIAAGMSLIHQDDDIVVIDKPVGVAAHPSAGWTGPTVLGHLAAAGVGIRTSGDP